VAAHVHIRRFDVASAAIRELELPLNKQVVVVVTFSDAIKDCLIVVSGVRGRNVVESLANHLSPSASAAAVACGVTKHSLPDKSSVCGECASELTGFNWPSHGTRCPRCPITLELHPEQGTQTLDKARDDQSSRATVAALFATRLSERRWRITPLRSAAGREPDRDIDQQSQGNLIVTASGKRGAS
jgi:hypothetical protein